MGLMAASSVASVERAFPFGGTKSFGLSASSGGVECMSCTSAAYWTKASTAAVRRRSLAASLVSANSAGR